MKATAKLTFKIKTAKQNDPFYWIEKGHAYAQKKQFEMAESCFKMATKIDALLAAAHNNLGQVQQTLGKTKTAIFNYQKAIALDENFILAHKNLASVYFEMKNYKQAQKILVTQWRKHPDNYSLIELLTSYAMYAGNLKEAAKFGEAFAQLRCGYYPNESKRKHEPGLQDEPTLLSIQKLTHDIEQLRYLKQQGVKIRNSDNIIKKYLNVLKKIKPLGDSARIRLDETEHPSISKTYNKLIYRPYTPRLSRALSKKWAVVSAPENDAEKAFKYSALGLTVIDNFLTPKALMALRKFCCEATVWFENSYSHGRLGAFFRQGFNCPLLIQIGEEIKVAFPSIIGEEHALLQILGLKCGHFQPPIAPHADFAAVNVNFWITPEEANLDPNTGGMIIYDVEAPLNWNFENYNNQGQKIINYLKKKKAKSTTIPYKANRAIIFNSDLFHVTAPVNFREDYASRRINITLLYGKRENALSHQD